MMLYCMLGLTALCLEPSRHWHIVVQHVLQGILLQFDASSCMHMGKGEVIAVIIAVSRQT